MGNFGAIYQLLLYQAVSDPNFHFALQFCLGTAIEIYRKLEKYQRPFKTTYDKEYSPLNNNQATDFKTEPFSSSYLAISRVCLLCGFIQFKPSYHAFRWQWMLQKFLTCNRHFSLFNKQLSINWLNLLFMLAREHFSLWKSFGNRKAVNLFTVRGFLSCWCLELLY